MEVIFGIFAILLVLSIIMGFNWIMAKYFGVRVVGRYQVGKAIRENVLIADQLKKEDKSDIEEATKRCKEKHYSLTTLNILNEIYKIKAERVPIRKETSKFPNLKEKLSSILKDKENSSIQKLERLYSLKKEGALSEDEFIKLRTRILSDLDLTIDKTSSQDSSGNSKEELKKFSNDLKEIELIKITSLLFQEFKNEYYKINPTENMPLETILVQINFKMKVNKKQQYLVDNYNSLSRLFFDGIISKEEFAEKKKVLFINLIS